MAVAPPIMPVESDVHLLTSISELDASLKDAAFREGLSFNSGVECATVGSWPSGCAPLLDIADDTTWKAVTTYGDPVTFKSFIAYHFVECPAGYVTQDSDGRRAQILRTSFDAVKHIAVARQLWFGDADANGSPTLRTAAYQQDQATTVELIHGIAALVAAHKALAPGPVFIHGPWLLVPYLEHLNVLHKVNGRYEGLGWVYVVDEGYPVDGTAGPQNAVGPIGYRADVSGSVWIYATGRIEYAWGPYIDNPSLGIDNPNDGRFSRYSVFDSLTNRSLVRVEQQAFIRFDPCSVLAQRVTVP